jgi:hypothetical protein
VDGAGQEDDCGVCTARCGGMGGAGRAPRGAGRHGRARATPHDGGRAHHVCTPVPCQVRPHLWMHACTVSGVAPSCLHACTVSGVAPSMDAPPPLSARPSELHVCKQPCTWRHALSLPPSTIAVCFVGLQPSHAAFTCSLHMQPSHAAFTCSLHMQPSHAAFTCSLHMQPSNAAFTCSNNISSTPLNFSASLVCLAFCWQVCLVGRSFLAVRLVLVHTCDYAVHACCCAGRSGYGW